MRNTRRYNRNTEKEELQCYLETEIGKKQLEYLLNSGYTKKEALTIIKMNIASAGYVNYSKNTYKTMNNSPNIDNYLHFNKQF